MNKAYKYTLLTVFLAVVFIFGSMTGMKLILQIRERQLLTESGSIVMETPVRSWQTADNEEGEEENAVVGKETDTLTTEQMEEVINGWNQRTGVTVHSPVNGQISMEDAIETAQQWLAEMGMNDKEQERETDAASMSAVLGVATQEIVEGVQLEPYYSFWTVQMQNDSIKADIYINAVTGKVWGAEITLEEDILEKMSYEQVRCFAELSGFEVQDTDIVVNAEGTQAIMKIGDSQLYAEMEFASYSKENTKFLFQLTVGKEKI
jgi:hypothetical protein